MVKIAKMLLLFAMLFAMAGSLRAQVGVAVTANLKDLGLNNVTSPNTYVAIQLQNFGSTVPTVVGSNIVVSPNAPPLLPNTNGVVTGNIQPNDTISPANTFYSICIYYQGLQQWCQNYEVYAALGTFNLNVAAPLLALPPPPLPLVAPNTVYAGPPSGAYAGMPIFRPLVSADIPGGGGVSPGTNGFLSVYTAPATVGSSSLLAAQVPLKNMANTFTNSQTFSADPIYGSAVPWTDVRFYGSVCNGGTDSSAGINLTFASLAPLGGTAFLPDNCNYTPPSSLPTSGSSSLYSPTISLGGQLNLTSTLHLSNYWQLSCQTPSIRAPAAFGAPIAANTMCPVQPYPFTTTAVTTPYISEESNAFVLKDLYLQLFCGSGIKIFPTNMDDGIVENVFANGSNCAGNSVGVEQNQGFGVQYKGGGFQSSRLGTTPSIWMHSLTAADPPGSLTTFDHTFTAIHGTRYDTSGGLCAGNGYTDNIRSVQQLYESANYEGTVPPDSNSPMWIFDVAHCTYRNLFIDSPEMVDTTGYIPLISAINSTGTPYGSVNGLFLLNPIGDFSGPYISVSPAASVINSTIFAPAGGPSLGLYGGNCSYFTYIAGNQVNCNSATNVPVADIAGHVIGMASPPSSMSCSASMSGGSLATGTYYVLPAAEGVNVSGGAAQSVLGGESVVSVTGPTGSIACVSGSGILTNGSTGIRFYYGTTGSLLESAYERSNAVGGVFYSFTIVGSGAVSGTPSQLQPNPATMAAIDSFGGQYETVATADTPVTGPTACFGIGMRCTSLGNFRTQIAGNVALRIGGFDGIFTHANTATRTYTFPDATGTVCLTTTGCGPKYEYKPCGFVVTGTGAGGVLQNSDMGPTLDGNDCIIDNASTVFEIDVSSDTGAPSIILGRNRAGVIVNLVSSALAAAGPSTTPCSKTAAVTGTVSPATCSGTLQNTALNVGDWLGVVSGTADGVAKRITVVIWRSVN